MLKHIGGWPKLSSTSSLFLVSSNYNTPLCTTQNLWSAIQALKLSDQPSSNYNTPLCTTQNLCSAIQALKLSAQPVLSIRCRARRRVRYEDEDEGEEDEYGHNAEIATLELYSQSARGEALLVHAMVDDQDVEVLIFKGFSSCLSYRTSPDPSKSILPAAAVIQSIDRIKGPFNPSNIEYIEKGLTWDAFKARLLPN